MVMNLPLYLLLVSWCLQHGFHRVEQVNKNTASIFMEYHRTHLRVRHASEYLILSVVVNKLFMILT